MKKTKVAAPIIKVAAPIILEKGALAIWVDYDGRYETNETTVRILDYNCFDHQYLVERPASGMWELVHRDNIKAITFKGDGV